MSTKGRLAVLGAVIVFAVVGIIVAGGGNSSAPKNATVTIQIKNAKPVGGVKQIKVKKGGTVDVTVVSDTADEIHVHYNNAHKDVKKGGSVHFRFTADSAGASEIELEGHKQQIAALTVEP